MTEKKLSLLENDMKKLRNLINQIIQLFYFLYHYYFMYDQCVFVKAWVKSKKGYIIHNNWGDDINYYFLHLISGKKIIFFPTGRITNLFHIPCLLGIGSLLSFWSLDNMTIIGSGILAESSVDNIRGTPSKVCFVRGPISRKILCEKGIETPEIYGDLALALPLYYYPKIAKKFKLGIVLHYADENLDTVNQIKNQFSDIKFIYMRGYKKWTDIIDSILSCEVIFSSSLHGLICAEAYKVPCQWIYFSDERHFAEMWPTGWKLKFYDFYFSIQKNFIRPIEVNKETDIHQLGDIVRKEYVPSNFDAKCLVDALPDTLKSKNGLSLV